MFAFLAPQVNTQGPGTTQSPHATQGASEIAEYSYKLLRVDAEIHADDSVSFTFTQAITALVSMSNSLWYFDWPDRTYSDMTTFDAQGPLQTITYVPYPALPQYRAVQGVFRNPLNAGDADTITQTLTVAPVAFEPNYAIWYWGSGGGVGLDRFVWSIRIPDGTIFTSSNSTARVQTSDYAEWEWDSAPAGALEITEIWYAVAYRIFLPLISSPSPFIKGG